MEAYALSFLILPRMKGYSNMQTKRAYLAGLGLAKADGRGRFSTEAMAALNKATSEGMTFVDNEPVKPAKPVISTTYDARKVRKWAASKGIQVGERGRIPAEIVQRYLDEVGEDTTKELVSVSLPSVDNGLVPAAMKVEPKRPETVAFGYSRRAPDAPSYLSEPLVSIANCGKCGAAVAYCGCTDGPFMPKYLTNGVFESAMLRKPE